MEDLSDTLTVFDEAHNLPTAVEAYNNVTISNQDITQYINSIESKKKDPSYITFLSNISSFLDKPRELEESYTTTDFIIQIDILDINFYQIQKIINKRKGYLEKINMETENKEEMIHNENVFERIKTACGLLAKNSENVFVKANKYKTKPTTNKEVENYKRNKYNTNENYISIFCMDITRST